MALLMCLYLLATVQVGELRAKAWVVARDPVGSGRAVTQEPALTSQAAEHPPRLLILSRPPWASGDGEPVPCSLVPITGARK